MITQIVPACVVAVDSLDRDPRGRDALLSAVDPSIRATELAQLGAVAESRRIDFLGGRACAHRALRQLGVRPAPILRGPGNEPGWPTSIVGAITHCSSYRAAAVAQRDRVLGLGIDAEPCEELPTGLLPSLASESERAHLAALPADLPYDRVFFSAKESLYKLWFPLHRRWLGFHDATVSIGPEPGVFRASIDERLAPLGELRDVTGRYVTDGEVVATAIVVTRGLERDQSPNHDLTTNQSI